MKSIIEQIEELLVLEKDRTFRKASEILKDSSSTTSERIRSKEIIFKTAIKKFVSDERIEKYMPIEEKNFVLGQIQDAMDNGDISDTTFYRVLSIIEDCGYKALVHYYLDIVIPELKDLAVTLGSTTSKLELEEITVSSEASFKKHKVKNALNEMILAIRTKAHLSGENRRITDNMKKRLQFLMSLRSDINDRLESADKVDYWTLKDDIQDFIKKMNKTYSLIINKIDEPFKHSEPVHSREKVKEEKHQDDIQRTTAKNSAKDSHAREKGDLKTNGTEKPYESPRSASQSQTRQASGSQSTSSQSQARQASRSQKNDSQDQTKESPFALIRKAMGGKLKKSIKGIVKRRVIRTVAGGLVVVMLASGIYILGKKNGSKQVEPDNYEKPTISTTFDETEINSNGGLVDDKFETSDIPTQDDDMTSDTVNREPSIVPEVSTQQETIISNEIPSQQETITNNSSQEKITTVTTTVKENWSQHGEDYSQNEIEEVVKSVNGQSSTISLETADEVIIDMLNKAIVPSINNILAGENNSTSIINITDLIIGDKPGIEAVKRMEANLNGSITDPANIKKYCESAFLDEAILLCENGTVNGLNVSSGSSTDPILRIIWARLAQGLNVFAGTLGDELYVELDGKVYTQTDINNGPVLAEIAKKSYG